MPLNILNKLFNDEWNAGQSNSIGLCVGDKLTAEVSFEYVNYIDAQISPDVSVTADDTSSFYFSTYGSRQCFYLNDNFGWTNQTFDTFYQGQTINVSGFANGSLNTSFVVDAVVIDNTLSQPRILIVTTSAFITTENDVQTALIYLEDIITDAEIEFALNRNGNNDDTIIPVFGSGTNTPFFIASNLDPTDPTPQALSFGNSGAWRNGTMTIQGDGIGSKGEQRYITIQEVYLFPISTWDTSQNGVGLIDNSPLNELDLGTRDNWTYGINPRFQINQTTFIEPLQNSYSQDGQWRMFDTSLDGASVSTQGNYEVTNFTIFRTSDSEVTDVPIIREKFTVEFDLENDTDDPFSDGNTEVKVGIEQIPESYIYGNLPSAYPTQPDYFELSLFDRARTTLGNAPISGEASGDVASITNYTATFNSSSSVSISFDVEFTSNAQDQLLSNVLRRFTIWAETQDHTKTLADTDRTNILAFFGDGIENIVDTTPVNTDASLIEFPFTETLDDIASGEFYPVNTPVIRHLFNIDWTDRTDLSFDIVRNQIVLKNTVTDEEILLETTTIPVSSFNLLDNLYPSANYTENRGYQIPSDEVRNNITLNNRLDLDALESNEVHWFEMLFPFKVRQQYWQSLTLSSIPPELIDQNEPNDGLNNFWYRLQTITDWRIFHRASFDFTDGAFNFTQNIDNELTLYDYESNQFVVSRSVKMFTVDGLTELKDSNDFPLINKAGKTLVEVSCEMDEPIEIDDFDVQIKMEVFEQGTNTSIQRISSVNGLLASSPFEGITIPTLIDKEINGNFVRGKALIDGSKIANATDFDVYGEFYFYKIKLTEDDQIKELENDNIKIVD